MILTPLQKLPNDVGDLGEVIIATSFEWLPKGQKITKPGHTGANQRGRVPSVPNNGEISPVQSPFASSMIFFANKVFISKGT